MLSNPAFFWQDIFDQCVRALCLCWCGGPPKSFGLWSPIPSPGPPGSWLLASDSFGTLPVWFRLCRLRTRVRYASNVSAIGPPGRLRLRPNISWS